MVFDPFEDSQQLKSSALTRKSRIKELQKQLFEQQSASSVRPPLVPPGRSKPFAVSKLSDTSNILKDAAISMKPEVAENCNPSTDPSTSNGSEDAVTPIFSELPTWNTPQITFAVERPKSMDMPDEAASLVELLQANYVNSSRKSEPGTQEAEPGPTLSDRAPLAEKRSTNAFNAVKELFTTECTFLTNISNMEFVSVDLKTFKSSIGFILSLNA